MRTFQNPQFENVKDLVFKKILQYENHPITIAINKISRNSKFIFHEANNEKIIK